MSSELPGSHAPQEVTGGNRPRPRPLNPPLPEPFGFGSGLHNGNGAPPPPPVDVPQHEQLSPIDDLLHEWDATKRQEQHTATQNALLNRWTTPIRWGVGGALTLAVLIYAGIVTASYSRAAIVRQEGDVTRFASRPGIKPSELAASAVPLSVGDTIGRRDLPLYIATGAQGDVTLSLAGGEAVRLAPNSLVELRELSYKNGAIRRFVLWNGRIGVRTRTTLFGAETFTVETGQIKADCAGDSRLSVTSGTRNGTRFSRFLMVQGETQVVYPGGESAVTTGEQVSFRAGEQMSFKEPIPLQDAALAMEEDRLADAPLSDAAF